MKNLVLAVICILIVLSQFSVAGVFFSSYRIPDLTLALVVALVLALGFRESLKWILLAGLLVDAISKTLFGTTLLAFFLIGLTVSWIADVAELRSRKAFFLAAIAVIVAVSETVKDLMLFGSSKLQAGYLNEPFSVFPSYFGVDYFFKVFYTILAAYFVYYILRRMSRARFWEPMRIPKVFR
jgi:rod shape-determining protein MreD